MMFKKSFFLLYLVIGTYTTVIAQQQPLSIFPEQTQTAPALADTNSINDWVDLALKLEPTNYDTAITLLKNAYTKSMALNYDYGITLSLTNLAHCYIDKGLYSLAQVHLKRAEPYALKSLADRKSMLAMFYASMSSPYYYLNRYDSMAYYEYKAEAVASTIKITQLGEARHVASIYSNISMLWFTLKDFPKAIFYGKKALLCIKPYQDEEDMAPLAAVLNADLGLFYYEVGDFAKSKKQFLDCFHYNKDNVTGLLGLGRTFMKEENFKEALPLLEQALLISENERNYPNILNAQSTLGTLLFKLGEYGKSKKLLKELVSGNGERGNSDLINLNDAVETLAGISAAEGDYKQAYQYQKQSRELMDSILKIDKIHAVYALEIKSQEATKNHQIEHERLLAKARESKLREKIIWIGAIGACCVLFAISLISAYRSSKHKQKLQAEKINSMQQEMEIDNLKSMIKGEEKERTRLANELHDGIMVQLSTVKMNIKTLPEIYKMLPCSEYIKTAYYRGIIQQMEDATTELRRTAHNLMPDMLLQDGLAGAIFYFCNTLQQSTGLNIFYQQLGDVPHLQKDFELSVYRIVQELIQNILKHASATKVIVQLARVEENTLAITVEDDGVGFNVDDMYEIAGMGLKSIRTRVQVLKGMLDLQSKNGEGTTAHIEFDLSVYKEHKQDKAITV